MYTSISLREKPPKVWFFGFFHVFTKIRMKGDVFAIFSDELSVEDISSIILSYHEQELHFLSLRIDFLKSKMTPKKD